MIAPGIYPLKSNMFYRLASPAHGMHYGETYEGKAYGAWFCAAFAGRWEHTFDGAKRLFVSKCYDNDTAFVAYCDVHLSWDDSNHQQGWKPAFEIQMQILKAARLLKKLATRLSQRSS